MDRADPFTGYSLILRTIIFVVVPAFTVWQFVRLRRALHVFQLEGYKRGRFLAWCRAHRDRALFLRPGTQKKPLVMTGRARRLLVVATLACPIVVLGASGIAHLAGGAPYDLVTWAIVTALIVVGTPWILVAADGALGPLQGAINKRYTRTARAKLDDIDPVVVGVTGSFAKTSTKFAIARLLGEESALATPGSFNTPLGVSRAVNEELKPGHRFFVVEMGAYKEGDIAELCRFVRPTIGVLTAVGPAHLERFGSMAVIRRAKYELIAALPPDGIAVTNVDDPEVRALADETGSVRVVRYGLEDSGHPHVTARDVVVNSEGTAMTIVTPEGSIPVHTGLLGRHSIGHILAAVAVATATGHALAELAQSIAGLEPVEHRLQIIRGEGGVTVVDDAYNSNPDGAAAALEVLAALPGGRKVVVTPGMVELGPLQHNANEAFGAHAARVADLLIVVARVNRAAIVAGAAGQGGAEVVVVDTLDAASGVLKDRLRPGDVVLFENDLPDQYEG